MRFQNISHSTSAGVRLDDYDREKSINREHSLLIPGQHCCSGSSQSNPHRAPNKTLTASPAPRLLRLNLGDSSLPTTLISQIASNGPLIIRLIKLDTAAPEPLSSLARWLEEDCLGPSSRVKSPHFRPRKKTALTICHKLPTDGNSRRRRALSFSRPDANFTPPKSPNNQPAQAKTTFFQRRSHATTLDSTRLGD